MFKHPGTLEILRGKRLHSQPVVLLHMCQFMHPQHRIRGMLLIPEDDDVDERHGIRARPEEHAMTMSKNNFRIMNNGDSLATWTGERESFERSIPH